MGVRKKKVLLTLTAVFVAAAVTVMVWPREREPEYQGKKLSEWLAIYDGTNTTVVAKDQAAEAVRQIGTNAVPWLIKYERPVYRQELWAYSDSYNISDREIRANQTVEGFKILGETAGSAAPDLAKRLERPRLSHLPRIFQVHHGSWIRAASSLDVIGAEGRAALLSATTNQAVPDYVRAQLVRIVYDMPHLKTNGQYVVQIMVSNLKAKDPQIAQYAALTLAKMRILPQISVPALAAGLSDPSQSVRVSAAGSLGVFGPDAQAALPMLEKALNDQDPAVRAVAKEAIIRIAPEVLETNQVTEPHGGAVN